MQTKKPSMGGVWIFSGTAQFWLLRSHFHLEFPVTFCRGEVCVCLEERGGGEDITAITHLIETKPNKKLIIKLLINY